MGLCNILFALLSPCVYGHQHRSRKRSVSPDTAFANDSTLCLLLVFGWFQNMTSIAGLMTWLGICVVRVTIPKKLNASLMMRIHDADLHPIPSRLERSRPRPEPPPIQILPSTLRGMVRHRHHRGNPFIQWLLCVPPRELGHGGFRHELHSFDVRSDLVRRREFRDEEQVCQG